MWRLLFCLLVSSGLGSGYKVLVVFSFPRPSHGILGEGFVRHLLNAGHEVTYITSVILKTSHVRLRQIDISSIYDSSIIVEHFNFRKYIEHQEMSLPRDKIMFVPANLTLFHENLQRLIHNPEEEFDVVIAEWMFVDLVGSGLAAVFNCPLIWSTTMEPINPYLTLIQSTMNPAYINSGLPKIDPPFGFYERMLQFYEFCKYHVNIWIQNNRLEDIFKKAFGSAVARRGRVLPSFQEARFNASMILGNSFVTTGTAITLPQNFKQIGGYHIADTVKPLPKQFQDIMDSSEHGVIYFSLGSILHTRETPDDIKRGLMDVFRGLKQTVIWKFDAEFGDIPPNVHLAEWIPQQNVLAHKNCVLFITHGGLLSLLEAVHYGVPIIGIPVFSDQPINVHRAVTKGFGKEVALSKNIAKDLRAAIEDVMGNSSYIKKAKEYSLIQRNRLVPPGKELVFWVEHVIRTRGAPHLRPPAAKVPFYQKMYLDLILLTAAILYATVKGIRYLCKYDQIVWKLKRE